MFETKTSRRTPAQVLKTLCVEFFESLHLFLFTLVWTTMMAFIVAYFGFMTYMGLRTGVTQMSVEGFAVAGIAFVAGAFLIITGKSCFPEDVSPVN